MVDPTPRRVGKSSMTCTPFAFGGGTIADPRISDDVALKTVVSAWDSGARHFDTAPWYGIGRSERRLGMALGSLGVPRSDYTINTKVGRLLVPEPVRDQRMKTLLPSGAVRTPRDPGSGFRVHFDYTSDGIVKSYNDSLQRMGTSYIDSLTIHDLDYGSASAKEVELGLHELSSNGGAGANALRSLRDSGHVKAIGVGCNMTCDVATGQGNIMTWDGGRHEDLMERIAEIVDLDFIVMAGCYTLLEQRATKRLLPLCQQKNIGVVIATPFVGGLLAVGPREGVGYMYATPPPEILERTRRMDSICQRYGVPLAAAAIQFPLAHPQVCCAIPGARSPEEAAMNAKHISTYIPQDVWRLFREENLIARDAPTPESKPQSSL